MDDKTEPIETHIEDSNPSSTGPQGLKGDLGISSERKGPDGSTHGTQATFGGAAGSGTGDSHLARANGPEMDDAQQEATQGWRDDQPQASPDGHNDGEPERNPSELPAQDFDPSKNPGHSHG